MKRNLANTCHIWIMVCFLLATVPMVAAADIRTERVHFKKGTHNAVVKAGIKGYETVDYVLLNPKSLMRRITRIIAPGLPHHVTQRGNRRMKTFFCDEDYQECGQDSQP